MSAGFMGGLVGLAFGIADYVLFGMLIDRAVRRGEEGSGTRALDLVRKVQLVLFPLAGWFAAAMFFGNAGV